MELVPLKESLYQLLWELQAHRRPRPSKVEMGLPPHLSVSWLTPSFPL